MPQGQILSLLAVNGMLFSGSNDNSIHVWKFNAANSLFEPAVRLMLPCCPACLPNPCASHTQAYSFAFERQAVWLTYRIPVAFLAGRADVSHWRPCGARTGHGGGQPVPVHSGLGRHHQGGDR